MKRVLQKRKMQEMYMRSPDYRFLVLVAGKLNRDISSLFDSDQVSMLESVYRSQAIIEHLEATRRQSEMQIVTSSVRSGEGKLIVDLLPTVEEMQRYLLVVKKMENGIDRILSPLKMLHLHLAVISGVRTPYLDKNYSSEAQYLSDLAEIAWAREWIRVHDTVVELKKSTTAFGQTDERQQSGLLAKAYNAVDTLMRYLFVHVLEARGRAWYEFMADVMPQLDVLVPDASQTGSGMEQLPILVQLLSLYTSNLNETRLKNESVVNAILTAYLRMSNRLNDKLLPHEIAGFFKGAFLSEDIYDLSGGTKFTPGNFLLQALENRGFQNTFEQKWQNVQDNRLATLTAIVDVLSAVTSSFEYAPNVIRAILPGRLGDRIDQGTVLQAPLMPLFTLEFEVIYRRAIEIHKQNMNNVLREYFQKQSQSTTIDWDDSFEKNGFVVQLDWYREGATTTTRQDDSGKITYKLEHLMRAVDLDISPIKANSSEGDLLPLDNELFSFASEKGDIVEQKMKNVVFSGLTDVLSTYRLDLISKFLIATIVKNLPKNTAAAAEGTDARAEPLTAEEKSVLGDRAEHLRKTDMTIAAERRAAELVKQYCASVRTAMQNYPENERSRFDLLEALKSSPKTMQTFAHLTASLYTEAGLANPNQYFPAITRTIQRNNSAGALLTLSQMSLKAVRDNNNARCCRFV